MAIPFNYLRVCKGLKKEESKQVKKENLQERKDLSLKPMLKNENLAYS